MLCLCCCIRHVALATLDSSCWVRNVAPVMPRPPNCARNVGPARLRPSRCTRQVAPAMLYLSRCTRHAAPAMLRPMCCRRRVAHGMLRLPRCAHNVAPVMPSAHKIRTNYEIRAGRTGVAYGPLAIRCDRAPPGCGASHPVTTSPHRGNGEETCRSNSPVNRAPRVAPVMSRPSRCARHVAPVPPPQYVAPDPMRSS